MSFEAVRTWNGNEMEHLTYSWDSEEPMRSPGLNDKNGKLIFENDILIYKKYLAILKKGPFHYNGKILNGWYLECYYQDNKSINPFFQDEVYVVLGSIFENKNLYEKLKLREGVNVDDFVR